MLFGFFKVWASFQSYINKLLAEKLDVLMIVYLDNIFISTNKVNYADTIWWVFDQVKKRFWCVQPKKFRFYQYVMQFFEHMVFLEGVCMKNG